MLRLSANQSSQFEAVLAILTEGEAAFIDAVDQIASSIAVSAAGHHNFDEPARRVRRVIGERISANVQRGLIAKWMLDLPGRVTKERLPRSVLDLYPYWIDHLADWLLRESGSYDDDYWSKDVRFALALSVPGSRTQILDLTSFCRPGQLVRYALRQGKMGSLMSYVSCGGFKKWWLQTHTESRHLADFNEAGWDRLWSTAADVCETRPDLAGVFGSSWFFDPQLEPISPRLAFPRKIPLAGGAFMADQGPGDIHSARAGATSPSRRAMISSGAYVPHSWLMAWPRSSLLAWANHVEDTHNATDRLELAA